MRLLDHQRVSREPASRDACALSSSVCWQQGEKIPRLPKVRGLCCHHHCLVFAVGPEEQLARPTRQHRGVHLVPCRPAEQYCRELHRYVLDRPVDALHALEACFLRWRNRSLWSMLQVVLVTERSTAKTATGGGEAST